MYIPPFQEKHHSSSHSDERTSPRSSEVVTTSRHESDNRDNESNIVAASVGGRKSFHLETESVLSDDDNDELNEIVNSTAKFQKSVTSKVLPKNERVSSKGERAPKTSSKARVEKVKKHKSSSSMSPDRAEKKQRRTPSPGSSKQRMTPVLAVSPIRMERVQQQQTAEPEPVERRPVRENEMEQGEPDQGVSDDIYEPTIGNEEQLLDEEEEQPRLGNELQNREQRDAEQERSRFESETEERQIQDDDAEILDENDELSTENNDSVDEFETIDLFSDEESSNNNATEEIATFDKSVNVKQTRPDVIPKQVIREKEQQQVAREKEQQAEVTREREHQQQATCEREQAREPVREPTPRGPARDLSIPGPSNLRPTRISHLMNKTPEDFPNEVTPELKVAFLDFLKKRNYAIPSIKQLASISKSVLGVPLSGDVLAECITICAAFSWQVSRRIPISSQQKETSSKKDKAS